MGAWACPVCQHGRFLNSSNGTMRFCAREGCSHQEHIISAAKPRVNPSGPARKKGRR